MKKLEKKISKVQKLIDKTKNKYKKKSKKLDDKLFRLKKKRWTLQCEQDLMRMKHEEF